MPGALWDTVINFTDKSVVQCDVPAVKNTSLDEDNNDDCKEILMGIVNILFLKIILCIFLVLKKLKHAILFSHYYLFHSGFFYP